MRTFAFLLMLLPATIAVAAILFSVDHAAHQIGQELTQTQH